MTYNPISQNDDDAFYTAICAYLRGEPNGIVRGTVGEEQAEIAKRLLQDNPAILDDKDRLLADIGTIHYRESGIEADEAWFVERRKKHDDDLFADLVAYVRDQPHGIEPGTNGETWAKHAKQLAAKDPTILDDQKMATDCHFSLRKIRLAANILPALLTPTSGSVLAIFPTRRETRSGSASRKRKARPCELTFYPGRPRMARPRKRVCLEDGLRLDLNQLIRDGTVALGAATSRTIFWQVAGVRELVGVAVITADLVDLAFPRIRILMRGMDQWVDLVAQPRPFGGHQFYFRCSVLGSPVSVLWKPPGATRFCSRQAWGKEVAYRTQFVGPKGHRYTPRRSTIA